MKTDIEIVERSFGTCCISSNFLEDFYGVFLKSSTEISKMFAGTNLSKQKQLLRSGISHLLMNAKGKETSMLKLKALAKTHNRQNLNVRPQLYPIWVKSLMVAVKKNDPDFSPEVEKAWRAILKQGIDVIAAGY